VRTLAAKSSAVLERQLRYVPSTNVTFGKPPPSPAPHQHPGHEVDGDNVTNER
jgi:hypothetical protein